MIHLHVGSIPASIGQLDMPRCPLQDSLHRPNFSRVAPFTGRHSTTAWLCMRLQVISQDLTVVHDTPQEPGRVVVLMVCSNEMAVRDRT